jgi:hypothetical protein
MNTRQSCSNLDIRSKFISMNNQYYHYQEITSLNQLYGVIKALNRQTIITNNDTGYRITIKDLEKDGPEMLDWYDKINIKIGFKTQKQLDAFEASIASVTAVKSSNEIQNCINNQKQSVMNTNTNTIHDAWLNALKELE